MVLDVLPDVPRAHERVVPVMPFRSARFRRALNHFPIRNRIAECTPNSMMSAPASRASINKRS